MKPLYRTADIRAIEHAAAAMLPEGELMRRAGHAAACAAQRLLSCPAAAAITAERLPARAPVPVSAHTPAQGPAQASVQGPARRPEQSPAQASVQGPARTPAQGSAQASVQGPARTSAQASAHASVQGPARRPAQGSAHASAPGLAHGSAPGLALQQVLVLAGPGNNGGDALEAAAHLAAAGIAVTVWHVAPTGTQSPERAAAWQRATASGARVVEALRPGAAASSCRAPGGNGALIVDGLPTAAPPEADGQMAIVDEFTAAALQATDWQLVIDGLFGIGLARPVAGGLGQMVEAVNRLPCPVLALDVPSGLDADTGAIVGPDGIALRASHTITFIGDKPGLHTNEGRDHAGSVEVADLDIDPALFPPTPLHLNQPGQFSGYLRTRRHSGHKGTYGNVAVIGGGPGMRGAPLLSARAALHAGAGRVYVLFPEDPLPADSGQPELMCRLADGYDFEHATLAIGPGLGDSATAADLLARAIASNSALLIDADALNLLARDPHLQHALAHRNKTAVLTPHPLEAARLLGATVAAVQADRTATARTLAARLQAVVVLKGSGTVIAAPDGHCVINPTGNPALATAGTGDVLSGVCAALLAQGCPPWPAALAAVWLHGAAADALVAGGIGPIGMTAGELVPAIRTALNRLAS